MKKRGARDFEDLLQCAIPAFDGLLVSEEDNALLRKVLFKMTERHAFAKLRMHTDRTLFHLEATTKELGKLIRAFRDSTCAHYQTFELPRETAARNRRETAQALVQQTSNPASGSSSINSAPSSRKTKRLNLNTYKWHALGDYVQSIRLFGPSDSHSTQIVSATLTYSDI